MWWALVETLSHSCPSILSRFEYRYPYLDRDLVSFLFRVPREQLTRPGRRRSLMRRALRSLVPPEILERRRKAQLSRTPLIAFFNSRAALKELCTDLRTADIGLIDQATFARSMELVTSGKQTTEWGMLLRAILFEFWLRSNTGLDCRNRSCPVTSGYALD
ncbi:MAG: asparagine synthase-related protein [Terracidiphilus sp.]